MNDQAVPAELVQHLCATTLLSSGEAARLINEVITYFHETADDYVLRRHRELQNDGVSNSDAFAQIATELNTVPVRSHPLSIRQIRRVIYG